MIRFEVGKLFPETQYLNRGEITLSLINDKFFDVLCCIHEPTQEEIIQFKKGRLSVYLYEINHIPFVIFDLDEFNFDVSIDVTKINEEKQDNWLNAIANVINLYLVDSKSGILKAMRMISIPVNFSEKIRDICQNQLQEQINVSENISNINQLVSTDEMIKDAILKYTVSMS